MANIVLHGRGAIKGIAEGMALVSQEPIQGWGGIDEKTGMIIEKTHPFSGRSVKDTILVLSGGKGSTGWSCHFHAAKVNHVGPAGMIFAKMDSRTGVAAAVLNVPVVTDLLEDPFKIIKTGDWIRIDGEAGTIEILSEPGRA